MLRAQSTLLQARRGAHSAKPREFYDLVEALCPAPRYADLFSRYQHNDKWDCHGDEAPPPVVLPGADPGPDNPAEIERRAVREGELKSTARREAACSARRTSALLN
jgi:hypothetical protein